MDYGHSLELGYFLIPEAGDPRGVLASCAPPRGWARRPSPSGRAWRPRKRRSLVLGFGIFVLMGQPEPQMLRTFIEDVAPGVRERVATARALTGAGVAR
jgi:hypothetical protein